MKHSTTVVFAVFASLLAVTAVPANVSAASGTLVVGSQHTDFGTGDETAPQTLENLTVSGSGDTANVHLASLSGPSSTATMPPYNDVFSDSNKRGLAVVPKTDLQQVNVTLAASTTATHVYLIRDSDGAVLDSKSYSGAGTVLTGDMQANSRYRVVAGSTGSSYDVDANYSVTENVTASSLNITGGFGGSTFFEDNAYAFESITGVEAREVSDVKYVSNVHDITNSEEAAINITQASNVSVEATVRTEGGTVLGSDTITSTGNHTVSLADTSSSQLETVLDVTVTGENPQFELADESVLFHNDALSVDNTTASPTGDISQQNIQLSVDVSDPQFGSDQGEELTATFYVDGSQVGTDTLTSNGTASVNYTASTGGNHSWHVVVTDSYGASTTSDTFQFRAPSTLRIYNESNTSELLNNGTITLKFYGNESTDDPITVTKTVTDGTADLSGLPANQPFVVVASADGFHDRRIFISSLYDQQEIYLLPTSKSIVQPTYVLEDFSGYYPSEKSVLAVQREINGSYQTVVGDYFGATGEFEATLEEGVRHRLVIMNTETGRSRPLGTTMAADSSEQIIRVLNEGEIELVTGDNRAPIVGPSLSTLPAASTDITVTTYANDSQSYDITVTYQNETVTDTLATTTVSGNSEATLGIDLSNRSEGSVWVNITWTTADGNTATKSVEYTVSKVYVGNESLLHWIGLVPDEFGPNAAAVTSFISVLMTVLLMGVVGQTARPSGQVMGLVGLAGLASFAVIGWLSYDVLFASTVGYFGLIAIREGL